MDKIQIIDKIDRIDRIDRIDKIDKMDKIAKIYKIDRRYNIDIMDHSTLNGIQETVKIDWIDDFNKNFVGQMSNGETSCNPFSFVASITWSPILSWPHLAAGPVGKRLARTMVGNIEPHPDSTITTPSISPLALGTTT